MSNIKKFEEFLNEEYEYSEDDLVEMSAELDGLYDEGAEAIADAVNFLRDYYGEEFDEDTINDSMDVEDAIAELEKVEGDEQEEAQNIINNIEEINASIKELSKKIGDY
jgi:hypothetical protein